MNTNHLKAANAFAAAATIFGLAAGVAELVVGRSRWIGNKDDPTTLGAVTIGLALIIAVAAVVAHKRDTATARLAAGTAMMVAAVLGLTTAGAAWIPTAASTMTAAMLVIVIARRQRRLGDIIAEQWTPSLLMVLASIYLTFGIVAGGIAGVVGVVGAVCVGASIALRRTSVVWSAIVLVAGVLPFAVIAAWTVVIPLTALLMITLGLPHIIGSRRHLRRPTSAVSGGV
jgi:hypothetical protein